MNEVQVFEVIKQVVIEILPELAQQTITVEDSLRELGANSIDRAEILIRTMAVLQLKIPLLEFAQAKNIKELAAIFANHT